ENVHLQFSPSPVSYCKALISQSPAPSIKQPKLALPDVLPDGALVAVFDGYDPRYQRTAYWLGIVDAALYGGPNSSGGFGGVCQASERLWSQPESAQQAANFLKEHPLELSVTDLLRF